MGCLKRLASHSPRPLQRLNWGCGSHIAEGWINSDQKDMAGIDLVADIRKGLPLGSESIDYAVSIHALPEFAYPELDAVLKELRRVLRRGGVLRLALPDLRRGIDAYLRGDQDYFQVDPKEVSSLGGRFIVHMLWYGYTRTLFTSDFAAELLERAGFVEVRLCEFGETASGIPEITSLDNRPSESLFIEARRGELEVKDALNPYNRRVPDEPDLQILEITHAAHDDQLRGHFRVERVDSKLELAGWAVGLESPAIQVEVLSGGDVVAKAPPVLERHDIAEIFPDVDEAGTAGFQVVIEPRGGGTSHLKIQVELKDGEKVPLGEVQVATSPRGFKRLLRRRG